ncbi:MAG: YbaK/EbsC family protein [Gallionellaceae bacterium]
MNPNDEQGQPQPKRVSAALDFFKRQDLWRVSSRNSHATSCRDAAARRNRLGANGIPLHDELKSSCMVLHRADGSRQLVMLHARAHARFDLELVAELLGASEPLSRATKEELEQKLGTSYGTVNPFSEAGQFIQIFDEDVLRVFSPPHTMMTNLGHHEWAVEFEPAKLIEALKLESAEIMVAGITGNSAQDHKVPVIGIITGNGPESGMALWRHINAKVFETLEADKRMVGDLSFPRVLLHSLPEMGLSMELELREEAVWREIEKAVREQCEAGVTLLAIACNTTPFFADKIQAIAEPFGARFVSIVDVAYQSLRQRNLTDVTLLGIPAVAEMGERSAYRKLAELGVKPVDAKVGDDLQELGYMVKRMDVVGQDVKALNKLKHIIRAGVSTQRVLIALTEISVLLDRFPKQKDRIGNVEIIDPLRLYGEYLATEFLNALPSDEADDEDDSWAESSS